MIQKAEKKAVKKVEKSADKENRKMLKQKAKQSARAAKYAAAKMRAEASREEAAATKARIDAGQDAEGALCRSIKNQKHCGLSKYQKFCPASCKGSASTKATLAAKASTSKGKAA